MKIVEIKKDKKHTVRVALDTGRFFNFDLDYWHSICLHEGDSLTDEQLSNYLKESDYVRAKSRGLWFLDRADHSEKQLYQKITAGGISNTAAAKAVARLKELGLLDDTRLCTRLAERYAEQSISKREAFAKLMQKGIPTDIIKSVLEETTFDEASQIEAIIEKKYKNKLSDKGDLQKVYSALVRKGFSYGAVREAIKKHIQENEFYEEY